ncbi:hypothetical protein BV898_16245 [Hypsibius exemplaris]|uniref:Uncharacterized protein n=1 Tax=Hypsibius exemplaris TaxID=2072580 RepID=A0A9X6NEY3_HYPEX|nr:hypothetical protein BV898_16245 [Hypsibius exemplaris]
MNIVIITELGVVHSKSHTVTWMTKSPSLHSSAGYHTDEYEDNSPTNDPARPATIHGICEIHETLKGLQYTFLGSPKKFSESIIKSEIKSATLN